MIGSASENARDLNYHIERRYTYSGQVSETWISNTDIDISTYSFILAVRHSPALCVDDIDIYY